MRVTQFQERPDCFVILVLDKGVNDTPIVAFQVHKTLPESDGTIFTTDGFFLLTQLDRVVQFEESPTEFTTAVEWYHAGKLVRRDVNVILKQGSVAADALAANIG